MSLRADAVRSARVLNRLLVPIEFLVALASAIALWSARKSLETRPPTAWILAVVVLGGNSLVQLGSLYVGSWPMRALYALAGVFVGFALVNAAMQTADFRPRRMTRVRRMVAAAGLGAVALALVSAGFALGGVLVRAMFIAFAAIWCAHVIGGAPRLPTGRRMLAWACSLVAAGSAVTALELSFSGAVPWLGAVIEVVAIAVLCAGVFVDASDRERAEAPDHEALVARAALDQRRARAELGAAFDISTDAMHVVDEHLRLVACNETFRSRVLAVVGRVPEVGAPVERCYPPRERPAWDARYQAALSGKPIKLDAVISAPDGTSRIEAVSFAAVVHEGRAIGVAVCGRDATELRRLAEKMHANAEDYRALSLNATDLVLRVGGDGNVLFAAPSVERLLGWKSEDLMGRSVLMFAAEDDAENLRRVLREAQFGPPLPRPLLFRFRQRNGGLRLLDAVCTASLTSGGEPSVIVNARDVTERHALEAELRRRQRGASVGRLVTGIAHDFNNLLTAVLANASLARDRDPQATDLAEIVIAAERGRGLVRKLQTFAGATNGEITVFVPGERVADVDTMLQRFLGEEVRIRASIDDLDWTVQMDAGQFEQMLVNLAVAERAAMSNGGVLSIETTTLRVAVPLRGDGPPVPGGEYITVTVSGSGSRMGGDTAPRGGPQEAHSSLDVTRAIVERARGVLWVTPSRNRGTSYKVFLPRHHDVIDAAPAGTAPEDAPGGTETILIAEDDPATRTVASRILAAKGYTVLSAANGQDALQQARAFVGSIDLLLTDLVMPQVNGVQLARQLRARRANTRVVLMSGYTAAMAHQGEISDLAASFLAKPFTPAELLASVRASLDVTPPDVKPLSRSGRA